MISWIIAITIIYYFLRFAILVVIGISIDSFYSDIPPIKTILFEPFNFHKYIFFETQEQYEAYAREQEEKGDRIWWR